MDKVSIAELEKIYEILESGDGGMIYKIRILYKQVNKRNRAGFVPCPHDKGKQCPDVSCRLNCNRFISNDGEYLRCGDEGSNIPLRESYQPLEKVLESYGEYSQGSLAGSQGG